MANDIRLKHCPSCRITVSASQDRCPECGAVLEPGEAPRRRLTSGQRRLRVAVIAVLGALFGLMFGARMGLYDGPGAVFSVLLMAGVGAFCAAILGRLVLR